MKHDALLIFPLETGWSGCFFVVLGCSGGILYAPTFQFGFGACYTTGILKVKGLSMTKKQPQDRFPYEAAFIQFKLREGILPGTAEEYAGKLAVFFDGFEASNQVFAKTQNITKLSLNDLNLQFERIRKFYSVRTFNSIHGIVSQYYRFLIVELHLPVPPLT